MAQKGGVLNWYFIPLFPMMIIFFISALVETNRAPFDVVEGESEIVGGTHVEYSGMTFAVFFLAEYANMIFMAVLAVILFFGGWHSPFEGIAYFGAGFSWVPGIFWLLAKSTFFMVLYLWVRATFPRFRYDPQKPQKIHLNKSISYCVVRRDPSSRISDSMVIAFAGQTASHSLQAMQRSSPFG
jgi:NADH-quinone oxidoreductase subunit H